MRAKIGTSVNNGQFLYLYGCDDWINSNGHWGKEFIVNVEDDCIFVEKPNLDYFGEVSKVSRNGKSYRFYLSSNIQSRDYDILMADSDRIKISLSNGRVYE